MITIITIIINPNIPKIMLFQTTGPIMIRHKDRLKHTLKVKARQQVEVDQADLGHQLMEQKVLGLIHHTNIVITLLEIIGLLTKIVKVKNKISPITGLIKRHRTTMLMQFLMARDRQPLKLPMSTLVPLPKVKKAQIPSVILTIVSMTQLTIGPRSKLVINGKT